MNKILSYIIALGGAFAASTQCFAVSGDSTGVYRDFDFVRQQNIWLHQHNASGLTIYNRKSISTGEVGFQYGKGGLIDYYQSPSTFQVSANVESFYRLNKRTVVYGKMEYDNYTGKEMAGSAWIDPTRRPFDITEDSLTNIGKKHRDTYQLIGAFGIDLYKGFSLGARLDYTAANYAKYKDLRHKNSLMDMTVTVGLMAPVGNFMKIGANYYYHRNTESLKFSEYGKTERTYKSLINYGVFIGDIEQFSNSGLTDKNNEFPILDQSHGADVQLSFQFGNFSFFNNMLFAHQQGYYGKDSPYTIIFTRHHSNIYKYDGQLAWQQNRNLHQLNVSLEVENLVNEKQSYRSITEETGTSYYEYYDPIKTANKLWANTRVAYSGYYNINGDLPTTTLQLGVDLMRRKQTAYYYPYFRRQELRSTEIFMQASHNFPIGKQLLTVSLGGSWLNGSGNPFEDGTFITPSDKQTGMNTMIPYLYRNYDYLTASRYSLNGSVKYSFIIPKTTLHTYVLAQVNHRKTSEISEYTLGKDHTTLHFRVGCVF